jgi:RNA polymerase primary sigma factor
VSDVIEERQTSEPPELNIAEVRDLVVEGREQGYLNAGHIHDLLQDVELTAEQIDDMFILFNDLGIDIIEGDEAPDSDGHGAEAAAEEEFIPALDLYRLPRHPPEIMS